VRHDTCPEREEVVNQRGELLERGTGKERGTQMQVEMVRDRWREVEHLNRRG